MIHFSIFSNHTDDGLTEKYRKSALDVAVLKEHLGKADIKLACFRSCCGVQLYENIKKGTSLPISSALRTSITRQATAVRDDLRSQIRDLEQVLSQERSDMKDITTGLYKVYFFISARLI